jgi:hypothetical protein
MAKSGPKRKNEGETQIAAGMRFADGITNS